MRFTKLCPICGGRGSFLGSLCPHCNGIGGILMPYEEKSLGLVKEISEKLSEQEKQVFELYSQGLKLLDIARQIDLTQPQTITLLNHIEKKINEYILGE